MEGKFWNKYGLLNPTSMDIVSENTLLTTMIYLNLMILKFNKDGDSETGDEINRIILEARHYMSASFTGKRGVYHQFPRDHIVEVKKDIYTSPDQLIAMLLLCKAIHDYSTIKDINRYLWLNFWSYDNISCDFNFKRIMQPMVILLSTQLRFDSNFLMSVLINRCYASMASDRRDDARSTGAMKAFAILSTLLISSHNIELVQILVNRNYGEFQQYYRELDHPIRKLLQDILKK